MEPFWPGTFERIPVIGGWGGETSDVILKSVPWVHESVGMKKKEAPVTSLESKGM